MFMSVRAMIPLIAMLLGCRSEPSKPILVPVARVHYDGFKEGSEIITTLHANGIPATWEGEATVVFPILVPKGSFERSLVMLRTNYLVTTGKVQLHTKITREVR
jgi:type III secretory pathway lipoprotein EscJ